MRKITADGPEARSMDVVSANVERLREIFPDALCEGKVDFEVLKQLLGGEVDERAEKYGLSWHGKRRARQVALTPSPGTLRPCPEDSVGWDATRNLMIEGDNLEVLKLLQASYAGEVKMVYIDPPYNTGKDFVYSDDYRDGIRAYLELTGQSGADGRKLASNTEASGRLHTNWLNMMYPRLLVARSLLRPDGVIFVSIDEREVANLRLLLDELFGGGNFVAEFIWRAKRGGGSDNFGVVSDHEYIICYAKDVKSNPIGQLTVAGEELDQIDEIGPYRRGRELNKWGANSLRRDRPTMFFPVPGPDGVDVHPIRNDGKEGCWRWGRAKMLEAAGSGGIEFDPRGDGTFIAYEKIRTTAPRGKPNRTILEDSGQTSDGTKAVKALFDGENVFDFTKPPALIARLLTIGAVPLDGHDTPIVVDFFAGSGTTGQAVMEQNALDGGNRRYILVQLPEQLDSDQSNEKIAADFCDALGRPRVLTELTKERLRRAGAKVGKQASAPPSDVGFRVFKLDASNIRPWNPKPEDLEQALSDSVENILPGRSEQDLLYEVLLKRGLDLCVPIDSRTVAGKQLRSIAAGALFACLDASISAAEAEEIALAVAAWHRELDPAGDAVVVFRDSAFEDDAAKVNLTQILFQHGLKTVRSL